MGLQELKSSISAGLSCWCLKRAVAGEVLLVLLAAFSLLRQFLAIFCLASSRMWYPQDSEAGWLIAPNKIMDGR